MHSSELPDLKHFRLFGGPSSSLFGDFLFSQNLWTALLSFILYSLHVLFSLSLVGNPSILAVCSRVVEISIYT